MDVYRSSRFFLFFLVGKNKLLCLVMFDSLRCVGNIYHAVSLLFILISSLEPLMAAIILKDFFHSIFKRIHLENLLLLLSSWFLVFFFFFFFFLRLTCVSKWNHQKLNNSQRVFFFFFDVFFVSFIVSLWCQKVHQFHHQNDVKRDESLINFLFYFLVYFSMLHCMSGLEKLNNNPKKK